MPYYNRNPKRDHNFDNHPYNIPRKSIKYCLLRAPQGTYRMIYPKALLKLSGPAGHKGILPRICGRARGYETAVRITNTGRPWSFEYRYGPDYVTNSRMILLIIQASTSWVYPDHFALGVCAEYCSFETFHGQAMGSVLREPGLRA